MNFYDENNNYDLIINTSPPSFPDGFDCTVISAKILNSVKSNKTQTNNQNRGTFKSILGNVIGK